MERKIAELTQKIYQEGVEKAEQKAEEIVGDAQARSERIVADAKKKAEEIVSESEQKAQELRRNVESEIKLSSQQAIASLKQQIVDLIMVKGLDQPVSKTLSDPDVVRKMVETVAANWKTGGKDAPNLEVLLPDQNRKELEKAFKGGILDSLKKGVSVTFTRNIKGGFQIAPQDGTFKISLTDEDFNEFFREFLRPKTRTFLFGE